MCERKTAYAARLAIALALTGAASVGAWQPPQPPFPLGKGSIRGQVIDASSGAPVADATVSVRLQHAGASRSVQADAAGEFVIEQLPAGMLTLSARKGQAYSGGSYGQRSPDSAEQPFDLVDGEHATGVELRLWRNAVISGRVTDAAGRGIPGVAVQSLRLGIANGGRYLQAGVQARTDSTGRYRIERIWPGTYGVALVSTAADGYEQGGGASSGFAGYPTTFHPAASSTDDATLMDLGAGEEREGIDFTVTPSSMVSVAGTIEGFPAGARAPVVELCAGDSRTLATNVVIAKAVVKPDGRFKFPRVRPGSYVLRTVVFPSAVYTPGARAITQSVSANGFSMTSGSTDVPLPLAPLPPAPTLSGTLPVLIPNGDVIGLTMTLRPAGRIQGQVEFKGTSPRPPGEQLLRTMVAIMGADGRDLSNVPVARIEEDGRFSTAGLPPGRYALVPMTGYGLAQTGGWDPVWKQESMRIGDRGIGRIELQDADVTGVILTFSDSARPTELSGTVRDGAGRARPDATIYVFPTNRQDWAGGAPREVRPGRTGRYVVSNLPPRDYFIAAVIDEATELWREVSFLEKLSASAVRATVSSGETRSLDLKVR